ncbi:hypothetical protein EHS25_009944 [Saitozyma podzolica]|uniref:RRM domain-containing protein n=1 Tax=Saitozyma podzolica TaxID=1890683 RepID=A0A427YI59_9TREE|nr:hypothetical protein EHS25_009944 [Saitozyma podzolica]
MSAADPTPGPSRLPTITSEADELAAEAGIVVAANEANEAVGANEVNGVGVNGIAIEVDGAAGESNGTNGHAENGDVQMGGDVPDGAVGQAPDAEGTGQAEGEGEGEGDTETVDPNALPKEACETLYIQNLNEKVRIPVLQETLSLLFKPYRPVGPVVAHHNVRMRGQAFVSFNDKETADRARRDVNEFPLYGKAMQVSFARSRADSVVKKLDGAEALEEHKTARLAEKKIKRRDNPLRRKQLAKMRADESGVAPAKKIRLQVPDEYLPPNNVLFLQNLPDGTTSDDLREVFEVHPGLVEIRTIPAKKDIAFVEFADEGAATVAKDALHNFKIDGETKMKVTYAKK